MHLIHITVRGGVADIDVCPDTCRVIISDYDNEPDLDEYQWAVLSPDDIPISPTLYDSELEAYTALVEWIERFRDQGYYASAGRIIPIDELFNRCKVVSEQENS